MRTALKIFSFLFASGILSTAAFAASPFEIFSKYLPDITVTNIHQETKFVYVKVCNVGGVLDDTENTLVIAIKKTNGGTLSLVESAIFDTDNCRDFQVASVDELGITTSWVYNIAAGAIVKNGRDEKNKTNNTLLKAVSIAYPSKNPPIIQQIVQPTTYYPNANTTYCNASNNYCTNTNYNYNYNNNSSCNVSNNYCSTNNTNYYSNNNLNNIPNTCAINDTVCNNNYYSSVNNGQYQNTNNTSCTYANNYCNYTYNSNYYNNNYNNTQYCTSSNNYCSNNSYNYNPPTTYYRTNICPIGDIACNNNYYNSQNPSYQNTNNTSCTYANNYCNYTYNSNYYSNTIINKPDLTIQRLYQNSGDKHIIAEICNQGGDMINAVSIRTSFFANNITTNSYNTLQMAQGQCTSTVVYTTSTELGINYTGNYPMTVTVDVNNAVDETNESNNVFSQSLFLETLQTQLPDLIVDRIFSNDSTRTLTVRICNAGATMLNNTNWTMEIMNTNNNAPMRNIGGNLAQGQCIDFPNSYLSLSIYQSWGYAFRANVDSTNMIAEQSESNNSFSQYISLYLGY